MSQNRVDLVVYVEVAGISREDLEDLAELLELDWEQEAVRCVLSTTLASVDYDAFQIEEIPPIDSESELRTWFENKLRPFGVTVRKTTYALVPWYNGADRPVPESL